MFEQPIILRSLTPITLTEILIVLIIASMAYFVAFNKFEKHLPLNYRVKKLVKRDEISHT